MRQLPRWRCSRVSLVLVLLGDKHFQRIYYFFSNIIINFDAPEIISSIFKIILLFFFNQRNWKNALEAS